MPADSKELHVLSLFFHNITSHYKITPQYVEEKAQNIFYDQMQALKEDWSALLSQTPHSNDAPQIKVIGELYRKYQAIAKKKYQSCGKGLTQIELIPQISKISERLAKPGTVLNTQDDQCLREMLNTDFFDALFATGVQAKTIMRANNPRMSVRSEALYLIYAEVISAYISKHIPADISPFGQTAEQVKQMLFTDGGKEIDFPGRDKTIGALLNADRTNLKHTLKEVTAWLYHSRVSTQDSYSTFKAASEVLYATNTAPVAQGDSYSGLTRDMDAPPELIAKAPPFTTPEEFDTVVFNEDIMRYIKEKMIVKLLVDLTTEKYAKNLMSMVNDVCRDYTLICALNNISLRKNGFDADPLACELILHKLHQDDEFHQMLSESYKRQIMEVLA